MHRRHCKLQFCKGLWQLLLLFPCAQHQLAGTRSKLYTIAMCTLQLPCTPRVCSSRHRKDSIAVANTAFSCCISLQGAVRVLRCPSTSWKLPLLMGEVQTATLSVHSPGGCQPWAWRHV